MKAILRASRGTPGILRPDDARDITRQTNFAEGGRMPINYTVPVKQ